MPDEKTFKNKKIFGKMFLLSCRLDDLLSTWSSGEVKSIPGQPGPPCGKRQHIHSYWRWHTSAALGSHAPALGKLHQSHWHILIDKIRTIFV